MTEMKALDELREWANDLTRANEQWILDVADRIQAEIAERYMELPVDADGVPIHVGDTLECHANGYDGVFDAFAVGDGCVIGNYPECELFNSPFKGIHVARYCLHAKPRTVEDVLRDMVRLAEDTSNGRLDDGDIEGFADEIRELMGGGE